MSDELISLEKYRTEKELEPVIGRLGEAELAEFLTTSLRCWLHDLQLLQTLPADFRLVLIQVVRMSFTFGVAKTAYLADLQRKFSGNASWEEVCEHLEEMLPSAEELADEIG